MDVEFLPNGKKTKDINDIRVYDTIYWAIRQTDTKAITY